MYLIPSLVKEQEIVRQLERFFTVIHGSQLEAMQFTTHRNIGSMFPDASSLKPSNHDN